MCNERRIEAGEVSLTVVDLCVPPICEDYVPYDLSDPIFRATVVLVRLQES